MKKPAERYAWIEAYLTERSNPSYDYHVDVCNKSFVEAYCEDLGVKCAVQFYGAPKCPQLGADLRKMHAAGKLKRSRAGLGDMHSMGFPAWVWRYALAINPARR